MYKVYYMSPTSIKRMTRWEWSTTMSHYDISSKTNKINQNDKLCSSLLSTQLYHCGIKHKTFACHHPGDFPCGHFHTILSIALQFPNTLTRMKLTMASPEAFSTPILVHYTQVYILGRQLQLLQAKYKRQNLITPLCLSKIHLQICHALLPFMKRFTNAIFILLAYQCNNIILVFFQHRS